MGVRFEAVLEYDGEDPIRNDFVCRLNDYCYPALKTWDDLYNNILYKESLKSHALLTREYADDHPLLYSQWGINEINLQIEKIKEQIEAKAKLNRCAIKKLKKIASDLRKQHNLAVEKCAFDDLELGRCTVNRLVLGKCCIIKKIEEMANSDLILSDSRKEELKEIAFNLQHVHDLVLKNFGFGNKVIEICVLEAGKCHLIKKTKDAIKLDADIAGIYEEKLEDIILNLQCLHDLAMKKCKLNNLSPERCYIVWWISW